MKSNTLIPLCAVAVVLAGLSFNLYLMRHEILAIVLYLASFAASGIAAAVLYHNRH